jgi:hypothetical protein
MHYILMAAFSDAPSEVEEKRDEEQKQQGKGE